MIDGETVATASTSLYISKKSEISGNNEIECYVPSIVLSLTLDSGTIQRILIACNPSGLHYLTRKITPFFTALQKMCFVSI